jgi:putative transposase
LGLSGRVPPRVDRATKSGLLDLLEQATGQGWTVRSACQVLQVSELRVYRWLGRRAAGELADRAPGGSPVHGLLDWEAAEIIRLFDEWGEVDRSHRKLAHRGSHLERVWVSPASVRRVLAREGLRLRPLPRLGRSVRKPFPDWVDYRPGSIWIYDTTHFTRARVAATVVEDLVSRKWLAEIVSAEETSTQVQVVVTDALGREGLLERISARQDGLVDPTVDDPARPVLLALSDNGPQMTSGSTREFMALCAIHQHFGRPGTPTDQAWIESLFGHVKAEWPHLNAIRDPAILRAELAVVRERYNGVRLHAGIGYVTPNDEHEGRGPVIRKAARPDSSGHASSGLHGTASTANLNHPRSPAMLADRSAISIANSETGQAGRASRTVYGGHEHVLRQTLMALTAGSSMSEHENPDEATVQVLRGRVRLVADAVSWEGRDGDLLIVPQARHTLHALEDAAVLLTVAKLP